MNPDFARVLVLYAGVLCGALILCALVAEDAALPRSAKARARRLFFSKLDTRQRLCWHLLRRIEVVASGGGRYTISPYQPFNIRRADTLFCLQVAGRIPVYDKLLAQKLLIEADEQRFIALANARTRLGALSGRTYSSETAPVERSQ